MIFRNTLLAILALVTAGVALEASAQTTSKVIASDGRSAIGCVTLSSITARDSALGGGGRVLANGCSDQVSIGWCYIDGDCRTETGSGWNLDPGKSWPVSAEKEIRWGACHGKDTMSFEKGSFGLRVICKSLDETASSGSAPTAEDSLILRRNGTGAASAVHAGFEHANQWVSDEPKRQEDARLKAIEDAKRSAEIVASDRRHQAKLARDRENNAKPSIWSGVASGLLVVAGAAMQIQAQKRQQGYSPASIPSPGTSSPTAYAGSTGVANATPQEVHNPANEAGSCIVGIDKNGFAANGVMSTMGAVLRNRCPYPVVVTWCVVGQDCRPGYSNLNTARANSDLPISYDASKPGSINHAACRMGFTGYQYKLSPSLQHACK